MRAALTIAVALAAACAPFEEKLLADGGGWRAQLFPDPSAIDLVAAEIRAPARGENPLPDGLTAVSSAEGADIKAAWYEDPTTRYGHAVLGDAIEAGALAVETAEGRTLRVSLPGDAVFEDRTPRLADLDGDGSTEVVVIRASTSEGAAVTVYGLDENGALVARASTPFIGTPNRWLNIAGIADFLGTGDLQIAHVRTPHIGGVLILSRFQGDALETVAEMRGFSNHEIGARELRLSAVADVNGDGRADLALPSADRLRLRLVGVEGPLPTTGPIRITEYASVALPAPIDKAIGVVPEASAPRFLVGLSDGGVWIVGP